MGQIEFSDAVEDRLQITTSDQTARVALLVLEVYILAYGIPHFRQHVVNELVEYDINALAPILSSHWKFEMSEKYFMTSRWSERHAAYASGIGTFGLCDGLITEKGKAQRMGSVIARVKLEPTPRPYTDHNAYCLFLFRIIYILLLIGWLWAAG